MALAERREGRLAEELFTEHSRLVYAYCLRRLGSPEEAEDALQATYLNACRSLMRGFEPDEGQAWLLKVAHNVCISRGRAKTRRRLLERPQDLQAVEELLPAHQASDDELFGLEEALAGMPDQQRKAILLREWQGLSYREVAAELNVSQSAVETLIFRARRSLARALETTTPRPRFVHAFHPAALLGSLKSGLSTSLATGVAVAASATALVAAPIAADGAPHVFLDPPAPKVVRSAPAAPVAEPAKTAFLVRADKELPGARGHGKGKLKGKGKQGDNAKARAKGAQKRHGAPAWAKGNGAEPKAKAARRAHARSSGKKG